MNNHKLIVNNIIGEDNDGYSRVTVANALFNAVKGMRPELAFTDMNDPDTGKRVRRFEIDGIELFSSYDKETAKSIFIMKTEDAHKCHVPLSQQLADGPKTPFSLDSFDRTILSADERTAAEKDLVDIPA